MTGWRACLHFDPLPTLLARGDLALAYWVRRDLQEERTGSSESLWELPAPQALVSKQQADGSWPYPGKSYDPQSNTNYDLLETYRTLGLLVEMYGLQRQHPALAEAAGYLFGLQTDAGDIRGILGNQYMPYYFGAILTLLIRAGYADDPRVEKGLAWLLAVRQEDGGWVIPAQLVPARKKTNELWHGQPVPTDPARPFSHVATDMVLRAFAAHPAYRLHPAVQTAARLLKGRLFKPDLYNDRKGAAYWLKFQFPFWWHSLVATLDSLSRLGFERMDQEVARGLEWFIENQAEDGLWDTGYGSGERAARNRAWVGLAVCRVLKRYLGEE
ncbi:MAG: hypothetical protein JXB85_11205 [Anaerolineales bacterium]|nr:hypothetical protein [Anaerolineales bacterium]